MHNVSECVVKYCLFREYVHKNETESNPQCSVCLGVCVHEECWPYEMWISWQPQGKQLITNNECEQASVTAGPLLLSVS